MTTQPSSPSSPSSMEMMSYSRRLNQLLFESKFLSSRDDIKEVQEQIVTLCEENLTVLSTEYRGNLPLHHAAAFSPLPIVETIYSFNPKSIQVWNRFGNLPLHIACCTNRNDDVIQYLLDRYPNARTLVSVGSRQCPLHMVALMGMTRSPHLVGKLLEGCDETLLQRDVYNETPLMTFIKQQGRGSCPTFLCNELRNKTMEYAHRLRQSNDIQTLVRLFSSVCWDIPLLTSLLTMWPDFTALDLGRGMRPLHVVCVMSSFLGQKETIRFLVDRDPTILTQPDSMERTPAHYLLGAPVCQLDVLEYILQKNGDFILMEDSDGLTPLLAAAVADASTEIIYRTFHQTAFRSGSRLLASMVSNSNNNPTTVAAPLPCSS